MNSWQYEAVKEAIHIIDRDIKQPVDLELISEKVGMSKYHFHRLFKSITGKSLMSYVRGRRLSLSLESVLEGRLHIIDIANEYQFVHEQSYIRAFKQQFDMTPSVYRRVRCELPIEQQIDTNYLDNLGQGLLIKPRMCLKPGFCLMGLEEEIFHVQNYREKTANHLTMEFKENYLPGIEKAVDKNIYYGLVKYTGKTESNFYAASVEVEPDAPVLPPLVRNELPAQEYAVFRYAGLHSPFEITYKTIFDLYNYIDRWIMDTAYNQPLPYHFERVDLNICSDTYCEMDIYMPISAPIKS